MQFKLPKDDEKYHWTQHVGRKMLHYGLSADRIKRTIRYPKRCEEGVAPGTVAAMQPAGHGKRPWEVWVMYKEQVKSKKLKVKGKLSTFNPALSTDNFLSKQKIIITAWRYPGVSPVRDQIPIPASILAELKDEGLI